MSVEPIILQPNPPPIIEGVTISVNCAKMLAISLENNMRHFSRTLVITTPADVETQEVCKTYGADVLVTNAFYREGAKFDKGYAHERGLKYLKYNKWVLFFDADIILHHQFTDLAARYPLEKDVMYGCDRIYVTRQEHIDLMRKGKLHGPFDSGDWGFGFFQLFHMENKWFHGKPVKCRSIPLKDRPFGEPMDDYFFREQFGSGHMFIDGTWHWDTTFQKKLPMPCFHMGGSGAKSTMAARL